MNFSPSIAPDQGMTNGQVLNFVLVNLDFTVTNFSNKGNQNIIPCNDSRDFHFLPPPKKDTKSNIAPGKVNVCFENFPLFSIFDTLNQMCYWHQKLENPLPHPLPIRSLLPLAVIDLPIQSDSRQKGADAGADREWMRERILSHVTCLSQSESREGIRSRTTPASAPYPLPFVMWSVLANQRLRNPLSYPLLRASAPESIRSLTLANQIDQMCHKSLISCYFLSVRREVRDGRAHAWRIMRRKLSTTRYRKCHSYPNFRNCTTCRRTSFSRCRTSARQPWRVHTTRMLYYRYWFYIHCLSLKVVI